MAHSLTPFEAQRPRGGRVLGARIEQLDALQLAFPDFAHRLGAEFAVGFALLQREAWRHIGQPQGVCRVAIALTGACLRAPSTIHRIQPWGTGTAWKIECRPGARVTKGKTILIVESMKMEIPLDAPAAGRLDELLVAQGEAISEDQVVALVL